MFLLDTDVVSRTSPVSRDGSAVKTWLLQRKGLSFISVVTLAELHFGVDRLRLRGAERKASVLGSWLAGIEQSYDARLLAMDPRISKRTGELLARAEARGVAPGLADACIAASADIADYQVVTFNARHFDALGVPFRMPADHNR